MQYERRVIIRFLAHRNWDTNNITAVLKERFGQDFYALRTVESWLVEIR
jgi:hypothetical protein